MPSTFTIVNGDGALSEIDVFDTLPERFHDTEP